MQDLSVPYQSTKLPGNIAAAYQAVTEYIAQRSGLFRLAVLFLPPRKRMIARATYAFFRRLDDMVDEGQATLSSFRSWREQADKSIDQQTDAILITWSHICAEYESDRQLIDNVLDGIEMDIRRERYKTFDDFLLYCHRVATSGAFLALPILEVKPAYTLDGAKQPLEKLALAVQLTDTLWDIDEDLSKGRIYLPEDVLSQFGLTYQDIENRVYDERFREMMQHMSGIARGYFAEGWPVIEYFKPAERLAAGFGATVFLTVLDKLEEIGYNIYLKPITFSKTQKLWLLVTYLREYLGIVKRSWV
ncbi:MAG: squalene/phytoene synthase family protein [Anaerolineae bacterium]|nr:squalene/phytoene synthase family protein [Anaerolineae bacterium]